MQSDTGSVLVQKAKSKVVYIYIAKFFVWWLNDLIYHFVLNRSFKWSLDSAVFTASNAEKRREAVAATHTIGVYSGRTLLQLQRP